MVPVVYNMNMKNLYTVILAGTVAFAAVAAGDDFVVDYVRVYDIER